MKKFVNILLTLVCTVVIIVTLIITSTYIEGKYVGKSLLILVDESTGDMYPTSEMIFNYETHCVEIVDHNSKILCNFYIQKIVFSN